MKDKLTTFRRSKLFLRSNYQRGPWEWKPLLGLTLSPSSFSELTTSTTKWTQKLLQMLKNRRQAASSHPAVVCRASLLVWRVHHTGRGAWDLSTSPTMRNVPPWRREPRCGAGSCFLTESWSLISEETVWNWNYTYQLLKKKKPIASTNTHLYLFVLSKATRAFSAKHFCHHKKRELRVVQHPHGDFCFSPKLIRSLTILLWMRVQWYTTYIC